nr:hypothetical protein WMHIBSEC_WMHIBSEC_CDS_0016 [Caudoviricetes sp.]CAI9751682.1 hypothetical protein AZFZUZMX_AZFZUZMX_CDS_0016 [Caudoviricetes sp.]
MCSLPKDYVFWVRGNHSKKTLQMVALFFLE